MPSITPIPREERRMMQKAIHKTCDKNHARRLTAMLMLHRGDRVSDITKTLCCARSSIDAGLTGLRCRALNECSTEHPVFYEDEVDIHLNPKIGADWQLRGQQKRVVTPGQNEKYYLAGALHSETGKNHHADRG